MTKPAIDSGFIVFTTRNGTRLSCPIDFGGLVDVDVVEEDDAAYSCAAERTEPLVQEVHHHHYAAQIVDFVSSAKAAEGSRPTLGGTLLPVVPALAAIVLTFVVVILAQWAVPQVGARGAADRATAAVERAPGE